MHDGVDEERLDASSPPQKSGHEQRMSVVPLRVLLSMLSTGSRHGCFFGVFFSFRVL